MTKPYACRSSAQWQQIIDDQAQSDLSAPQYCQQYGVSYASFSKWRQHFSSLSTSPDASAQTLSISVKFLLSLVLGAGTLLCA